MKPSRMLLAALMALMAVSFAVAQQRLVVETGHVGAVNALAYDKQNSLLFSGGSDGTVRAWNLSTHELIGVLQAGHLPVRMIAVNPVRDEIATFETDNINTFRIVAWNWATGRRLFTHNLSEAPLFMKFSPQGSYLVYGVTAWRSLVFLDSSSGKTFPYFEGGGIGIVSDAIISDSEKSVMTYSPSGEIQYWTIDSGSLKQTYQTLPNLTAISFTLNSRYLVGGYNNNLVMVDLIGGQTVASTSLPGIQATSLDPTTDEIAAYSNGDNGPDLTLYSLNGGFVKLGSAFDPPQSTLTDIVFRDNVLVASQQDGTLLTQEPYYTPQTFGANNLLQLDDVAVNTGKMVLTSPDHLLAFGSNFFGLSNATNAQSVSFTDIPNPYTGPTGVTSLRWGGFVIWNQSGQTGSYRIYENGTLGDAIGDFPAPFIEAQNANGNLLTLDSQGTVKILNIETGDSLFSYTSFGLQAITYVSPQKIIAGRSQTGALNTALLQINPVTGETVPIPDSSIVVFDLAYDTANQLLYTLDIENSNSGLGTSTVLKSHPLTTLENGTSLLAYAGEDHSAGLAIDSAADDVFTSLGFAGVRKIDPQTGATSMLGRTDHIPRKLLVHGDWVISLNSDSTVTAWDRTTGRRVFDLYVFKDLSWAAVLSSGRFVSSPGAERYIKVFNGMKPSSSRIGDFQYSF